MSEPELTLVRRNASTYDGIYTLSRIYENLIFPQLLTF